MPFRDVFGHRRALGLLSRALAQRTLPPSLIFAGPEGVGQATHRARGGAGAQLPVAGHRHRHAA